MNHVYIETYGCSANQNNSEILKGILIKYGCLITNNLNIADFIILNTCIVKGKTENKIIRRIQNFTKYKNKILLIAGCMPETNIEQIKKLTSNAIFLGTHNFKKVINLMSDYKQLKLTSKKQEEYLKFRKEQKLFLPKIPNNKLISITQISEGCLGECYFCKTKLAKGGLFSYNIDDIIKSVENDLKLGAKEIWITSQDNASYMLDKKKSKPGKQKSSLSKVLKKILDLKYNFKLRLGMVNPNNLYPILDEIIEIYKNKKIYKFLHIPIQSASNKVLKNMNRKYKIKKAENIIKKFKKNFPNITIATDIIIGYPGETNKDFQNSLNFVKNFKPDIFNLSKFSLHKDTEIYKKIKQRNKIKQVPIKIINKRTTKIMEIHKHTALYNKKKFLHKEIEVFVNKKRPGFYEARDENYNIVLIPLKLSKNLLGKKIKTKIKQIAVHHMLGEIMSN